MAKPKVGIATWYRNGNFGGTLQAFALANVIDKFGYQSEFISYLPNYNIKNKILRLLKNLVFSLFYPSSSSSRKMIWSFVKNELQQSPTFTMYDHLQKYANDNYSAAICGSDQIWNCVKCIEEFYFLTFIEKDKRIAYAPSVGVQSINKQYHDKFCQYISEIPFLSIRETKGQSIIKEITGRNAKLVLDPTLLLTAEEWLQFSKKQSTENVNIDKEYILCYFIGENIEYYKFVNKFAAKVNLPIYYISSKRKDMGDSQIPCGVREFIKQIDNAKYFFTDSFHGLCFSIIFQKHVGVFWRFSENDPISQNSRVANLINLLNLNILIVDKDTVFESFISSPPNYCTSNIILDMLRKDSIDYLYNALQKVTNNLM